MPWCLDYWAEYDIKVYGEVESVLPFINTEHALVVLNHRGDLDWMIGWVLIDRMGMLSVSGGGEYEEGLRECMKRVGEMEEVWREQEDGRGKVLRDEGVWLLTSELHCR
jgi:hypothetical protein